METIVLSVGDERLGTIDSEGVRVFPAKDIVGSPAVKGKGGIRGVGTGYFVVIPIGFTAEVEVVVQDVSVDTSSAKKPIFLKPKETHEPDDNPA